MEIDTKLLNRYAGKDKYKIYTQCVETIILFVIQQQISVQVRHSRTSQIIICTKIHVHKFRILYRYMNQKLNSRNIYCHV